MGSVPWRGTLLIDNTAWHMGSVPWRGTLLIDNTAKLRWSQRSSLHAVRTEAELTFRTAVAGAEAKLTIRTALHDGRWLTKSSSAVKQVLFLVLQGWHATLLTRKQLVRGASLDADHPSMRQVVLGYMVPVADTMPDPTTARHFQLGF